MACISCARKFGALGNTTGGVPTGVIIVGGLIAMTVLFVPRPGRRSRLWGIDGGSECRSVRLRTGKKYQVCGLKRRSHRRRARR